MLFKCGKSMTGKSGGCCGSNESTNLNSVESKLAQLDKENENLKKKLNEMKG
jgi:hypothetical protein